MKEKTMAVTVRIAEETPNYRKTAGMMLQRCRDFYAEPENERAFQEWKAGKGAYENENHEGGILGDHSGRAGGADRGGVVHMRACG